MSEKRRASCHYEGPWPPSSSCCAENLCSLCVCTAVTLRYLGLGSAVQVCCTKYDFKQKLRGLSVDYVSTYAAVAYALCAEWAAVVSVHM